MPGAAGRMLDQLSVPEDARGFACLDADFALTPGVALPKPVGVFPRHVEAVEEGTS
jgi:methionyl-tRNA synthetase